MLPSRSRLQGWNPEALSAAASTIESAGRSVYDAVRRLDDRIDGMPEARGWDGQAHKAASDMFQRATDRSSAFKDYADAYARALRFGSALIGNARADLLTMAYNIDSGPLNVTDQWVVMVDPSAMSAERSAELQTLAEKAQEEVNEMASAVADADDQTTQQLLVARTM